MTVLPPLPFPAAPSFAREQGEANFRDRKRHLRGRLDALPGLVRVGLKRPLGDDAANERQFQFFLAQYFFNFIPDFQVGLDDWPCFHRPTAKGYLLVVGKRGARRSIPPVEGREGDA